MILFKQSADLATWLEKQRMAGRNIGFVPTLGALHEGHISLIAISKKSTSLTVCSIFVNPTQFNDPRDFQQYPITLEKDIPMLEKAGVDVLFLPAVAEMYPNGTGGLETYDLGPLETLLEGKYRPGHFQGVCQVMRRLLEKVRPDHLFMGSKDYQQCMVVQRLLTIMGFPTTLHRCPIIREADGLAMSSRNLRLTPTQRTNATAIYRALTAIKNGFPAQPIPTLIANATRILEAAEFRVDYVSIADAQTLEPLGDLTTPAASAITTTSPSSSATTSPPTTATATNTTSPPSSAATSPAASATTGPSSSARTAPALSAPPANTPSSPRPTTYSSEAATDVPPPPDGAVALIAAFQGDVRLIDNRVLSEPS
ncbi:MAG TPA: pantoate--beta-alanine ligase [Puia sp.]|nr:pantoate--beta-alanine ligase [Puia sp.]